MCSFQGCGRTCLSQFPAHQGPNSSEDIRDCRTVPGTTSKWWNNLETQQPILWSDEYLPTGGMLIPSVLSQQAHMVPCCRRLQQERLFSRGFLQFIYTVFCTCCTAWLCGVRQKRPLVRIGEIFLDALVKVCLAVIFACMLQSQWYKQYMVVIKNVLNHPNQWLLPCSSFRQQELLLSLREPLYFIHLSMLLPRHLMWQAILMGPLIAVTPVGVRGTYLCVSRQLSLRIM